MDKFDPVSDLIESSQNDQTAFELHPAGPRQRHMSLKIPLIAMSCGLFLLLLLSPFAIRAYKLSDLPDPDEPFDLEEVRGFELPDDENAFVEYAAAAKLLSGKPTEFSADSVRDGWAATDPEVREWAQANRPALQLWRKGTQKHDGLAHDPQALTVNTSFPLKPSLRDLVRLAALEGSRLETEEGDWDGAWGWYRAMFRCSRHCARNATLAERLVGSSIHSMSSTAMVRWAADHRVKSDQLLQAIENVRSDYAMTAARSTCLKIEYVKIVNTLESDRLMAELHEMQSEVSSYSGLYLYCCGEPDISRRLVPLVFSNWLTQIDKPRYDRTPFTEGTHFYPTVRQTDPTPHEIEKLLERTLIAKSLMLRAYHRGEWVLIGERARQAALLMALACQWHYRIHGHFPTTAAELVGPIPRVPTDPFTLPPKPMRYRLKQDYVEVWSVGGSGHDTPPQTETAEFDRKIVGFQVHAPQVPPR